MSAVASGRVKVCANPECREPFRPLRSTKQFCSDACRWHAWPGRLTRTLREDEVCPQCGRWCRQLDRVTGWCKGCTREFLGAAT